MDKVVKTTVFIKNMEDFSALFRQVPKVDAGLAASIFHFGEVKIPDLKEYLNNEGITVRI